MSKSCRIKLCLLLTAAASLLGGCSLAREELPKEGEDELVGVFLTKEHLSMEGSTAEINLRGEISFQTEEARIPGKIIQEEEDEFTGPSQIVFEGIEGYGIYSIEQWNEREQTYTGYTFQDGIFTGMNIFSGDGIVSMETTVYAEEGGYAEFYFNPVYQTPGGEIYMQPGSGVSAEMTTGMSVSQTLSRERTEKGNGEEKRESVSLTVHVVCAKSEEPLGILFMDGENSVIGGATGEELAEISAKSPGELRIPAQAAYLIVEQQGESGDSIRTVYNKGEECLGFLKPAGNGYLTTNEVKLVWE